MTIPDTCQKSKRVKIEYSTAYAPDYIINGYVLAINSDTMRIKTATGKSI